MSGHHPHEPLESQIDEPEWDDFATGDFESGVDEYL